MLKNNLENDPTDYSNSKDELVNNETLNLKMNFHLPSWFSFQDIFKLSNLENEISNSKNKLTNKTVTSKLLSKDISKTNSQNKILDNYEKLIIKEHKLPKEVKDELELVFKHFQDKNGNINPNIIKKDLKLLNFHKENPKIFRLIDELCFILLQNDKEDISYIEFIEFLEKKLLDFNSRKSLSEHYNNILIEAKESKENNNPSDISNKDGLNSEDLLKIFHSQEVSNLDLTTLKKMMKEIFCVKDNLSESSNKNLNENWDFELSNEDFYYIMTKRPEMVEAYFSINNKS